MNKTLKLKNYHLIPALYPKTLCLSDWLAGQMLHGKESRARTRFIKLITDRTQEIQDERLRLLKEHSYQDKEGEPYYLDAKGKKTLKKEEAVNFALKDEEKFQKEYSDYLSEECVIDVTPAVSETIYGVRDLLLNTRAEFTGRQATLYNEWCEVFQDIK